MPNNNKAWHCPKCRQIVRIQLQLQRHQRSGACACFFCRQENHAHELLDESFDTMDEAKAWIIQTEMDKVFVIKGSYDGHLLYRCRHYMKPQNTPSVRPSPIQRRLKVVIPALGCLTVFRVDWLMMCNCLSPNPDGNENSLERFCMHPVTQIRIRGCLTHCHRQEIRFLRLSQANKDFYISSLNLGLSKDTILKRYCNSHQFNTLDSKVTTLQELRNLERIYVNSGLDHNKTDGEDVCAFLERSDFRGFSFDGLNLMTSRFP